MTEVRRLREARKSQLQREQQLQARGRVLEEERAGLEQRLQEQQQAQERCQRLREDWEAGSLELLRLKDENYMIAMRLAQLSEEKNSAVLRPSLLSSSTMASKDSYFLTSMDESLFASSISIPEA